MKLLLPLLLLAGVFTAPTLRVSASGDHVTLCGAKPEKPKGRPVGKCDPYAEVCVYCSDCSACGHCQGKGGLCSKCKDKPER